MYARICYKLVSRGTLSKHFMVRVDSCVVRNGCDASFVVVFAPHPSRVIGDRGALNVHCRTILSFRRTSDLPIFTPFERKGRPTKTKYRYIDKKEQNKQTTQSTPASDLFCSFCCGMVGGKSHQIPPFNGTILPNSRTPLLLCIAYMCSASTAL